MLPFFTSQFGNAHSRTHVYGWESDSAVERAREQVASLIGADAKEIIFTSGATESNNMAIKGVAEFYAGRKNHIVTTQTDHKCVLDSCRHMEQKGWEVTYLPVFLPNLVPEVPLKIVRHRRIEQRRRWRQQLVGLREGEFNKLNKKI